MGRKRQCGPSRSRMTPATWAIVIFVVLAALRILVFRPDLTGDGKPRTKAVVEYVLDGDTFDLSDGQRVRMLGIDAPEAGFRGKRKDPFSEEATAWLRDRIQGREILLRIDHPKTDKYGRTLAWVFDENGTLVNQEMLRAGRVRLLADFGLPADLEPALREAESEARIRKLGIWAPMKN